MQEGFAYLKKIEGMVPKCLLTAACYKTDLGLLQGMSGPACMPMEGVQEHGTAFVLLSRAWGLSASLSAVPPCQQTTLVGQPWRKGTTAVLQLCAAARLVQELNLKNRHGPGFPWLIFSFVLLIFLFIMFEIMKLIGLCSTLVANGNKQER